MVFQMMMKLLRWLWWKECWALHHGPVHVVSCHRICIFENGLLYILLYLYLSLLYFTYLFLSFPYIFCVKWLRMLHHGLVHAVSWHRICIFFFYLFFGNGLLYILYIYIYTHLSRRFFMQNYWYVKNVAPRAVSCRRICIFIYYFLFLWKFLWCILSRLYISFS